MLQGTMVTDTTIPRVPLARMAHTARALVFCTALLLCGATGVWAAAYTNGDLGSGTNQAWTITGPGTLTSENGDTLTTADGPLTLSKDLVNISGGGAGQFTSDSNHQGLTVTASSTNSASLAINFNAHANADATVNTGGAIMIQGALVGSGYYVAQIMLDGRTYNSTLQGTGTTVGAGGSLDIWSAASGSKSTHIGDIIVNGEDALLNIVGGSDTNRNTITGSVTITQGLLTTQSISGTHFLLVSDDMTVGRAGSVILGNYGYIGNFQVNGVTSISGEMRLMNGSIYNALNGMTINSGGTLNVVGGGNQIGGNGFKAVSGSTLNLGDATTYGYLGLTGSGLASFEAGSTTVLARADAHNGISGWAITGSGAGTLTVAPGAKLVLQRAVSGQDVFVVDTASFGTTNSLWLDADISGSAMQTYVMNADGTVSVATRSSLPWMSAPMVGILSAMQANPGFDMQSPNAGVRFASRALGVDHDGFRLLSDREAAATVEGAAQAAPVGAVQGATLSAQRAGVGALMARTGFGSPQAQSQASQGGSVNLQAGGGVSTSGVSGGSGGNGAMKNGLGLWIMPLWQSDNVFGMKAEGFKTGYTSNLGGLALGVDYTVENALRFGLAFNFGGGYAKSNGDFNNTDNSFNFWGVSAYAGWTQNNFSLAGDVGYSATVNTVRQDTPASMQFGNLKSDVNAHAWSAGLRAAYKWDAGAVDITPHVGIRYTGLTTQGFDVKGGGGTVYNVDEAFQALWTFPIGVTVSKDIATDSGWTLRPLLDLGIIPATGDVKAKSNVRIPGVNSTAEMKAQVVDYLTFDGTLGFELKNENMSVGLNYNLQASEHRTGHGVFATFRYEF